MVRLAVAPPTLPMGPAICLSDVAYGARRHHSPDMRSLAAMRANAERRNDAATSEGLARNQIRACRT
jgi:hypothetical protein